MLPRHSDPLVAIATAPGRGAVGIVRVSGKQIGALVQALCGRALKPREATYLPFRDAAGQAIDQGLALYFPAPHSYTGEDVAELQTGGPASAALPQVLNHQGRIAVQGVNFEGNGQFKFALVNADGTLSYWSNDGSGVAGAEPAAAVTLAVNKGLYAVLLGNPALPNMTAIPPGALEHEDVRLRVWFNDGSRGFQQISPDQRLAAVPYAIHAREALAADTFGGLLAGDVTGAQSTTAIADATVTGQPLFPPSLVLP
jgi:hypothetical protein